MGIKNLFESTANLTGFSDSANLQLDDAVHKAKIEVNEEGSTAAGKLIFRKRKSFLFHLFNSCLQLPQYSSVFDRQGH